MIKKVIPFPSILEPILEEAEEEGDEDEEDEEDDITLSWRTSLAKATKEE